MDDISSDQQYLRDIILSINRNEVSPSMARRSPGKLGYARWLTMANRILRYYITFADQSENVSLLSRFVINVYARSWFSIKARVGRFF